MKKLRNILTLLLLGAVFLAGTVCTAATASNTEQVDKHWSEWDTVKVAAAQVSIHTGTEGDEIVDYIDRAGKDGVQLLVLGEYILGKFPSDNPLESEVVKRASDAAKRNHIYVMVGGWEEFEPNALDKRIPEGYANTVLIFGRDGEIVGRYSKTHGAVGGVSKYCWPPEAKDAEWVMKEGDVFPTFQLDFARVGIMICYDGFFPECATSLSLNGAEIVCWLNGRAGPIEEFIVQADIFRNYCAMVTCNLSPGSGTMIGTWPASILAHITEPGNHYIKADIDLKTLREYRANSRTLHQRKPQIYGAITESHKPWEAYEPHGHVEAPVPPKPVKPE